MKTSIKALLILLISGCSLNQLQAGQHDPNEGPSAASSKESEKVIRHYFKFPQFLLPVNEAKTLVDNKVEVLFSTDTTGKVNFVLAKTESEELRKEIEKQFLALQLKQLKSEVVHKVILNFRTI